MVRPTESQAMGYAMALAAEYVRAAEHYPAAPSPEIGAATPCSARSRRPLIPDRPSAVDGSSSDRDSRVQSRPLLLMGGLGLSTHAAGSTLAPPVHSTRMRRDHPRTASGGSDASTLCDSPFLIIEKLPGKPQASSPWAVGLRMSIKQRGRRLLSMIG
ncbi:hypothetical protein H4R19_002386 [Coemansia spiralis]|nr:hypothetical protein H4R19_002386 [Coemansia spiralis]